MSHRPFPNNVNFEDLKVQNASIQLMVLESMATFRLQQCQGITNGSIISANEFPLQLLLTDHGQLAEAVMRLVKDGSDISETLPLAELAVALQITRHAVDDVSHGLARVGVVGMVVDDRASVNGAVCPERKEAFVPVDVAIMVNDKSKDVAERKFERTLTDTRPLRTGGGGSQRRHARSSGRTRTRNCTWDDGS